MSLVFSLINSLSLMLKLIEREGSMTFSKLLCGLAVSGVVAYSTTQACAADAATEKKADWHCEKKEGGKPVDVEAKDKNECKQKGGKWSKAHGEEGHGKDDGHAHD